MRKPLLKPKAINLTLAVMLLTFSPAKAAFAQALVFNLHEFDTFTSFAFVPCANGGAGEGVLLSGILHTQIHVTVSDGNRTNFKAQVKPQVVTGLGLSSGDVYRAVGLSHFHETVPFSSEVGAGAAILNSISIFRLIGPGPDNNFQMHRRVHRTINANGQITSTVDDTSVVCKLAGYRRGPIA